MGVKDIPSNYRNLGNTFLKRLDKMLLPSSSYRGTTREPLRLPGAGQAGMRIRSNARLDTSLFEDRRPVPEQRALQVQLLAQEFERMRAAQPVAYDPTTALGGAALYPAKRGTRRARQ